MEVTSNLVSLKKFQKGIFVFFIFWQVILVMFYRQCTSWQLFLVHEKNGSDEHKNDACTCIIVKLKTNFQVSVKRNWGLINWVIKIVLVSHTIRFKTKTNCILIIQVSLVGSLPIFLLWILISFCDIFLCSDCLLRLIWFSLRYTQSKCTLYQR